MLRYGEGTPDRPWGPHQEPATVCVAGDTAVGKSADLTRAFGGGGLWGLSITGGLKPGLGVWGVMPARTTTIENLHTARQRVRAFVALPPEHEWRQGIIAIGLDNVTQPASASHTLHEERAEAAVQKRRAAGEPDAKVNSFAVWQATMDLLLEIRDLCRSSGLHFAINGDLRGPSTDEKGRFQKGGIALPSKGRTADFARMTDLVVQAERRPGTRPPQLWGGRYLCGHDPDAFHGRDRHDVAPVDGPMNIGELLRGAGYYLPRHPLMEPWSEPLVAECAELVLAADGDLEAAKARIRAVRAKLAGGQRYSAQPVLLAAHMRWVLADSIDRAEIIAYHRALADSLLAAAGAPEAEGDVANASAAPWRLKPNLKLPRGQAEDGNDLV